MSACSPSLTYMFVFSPKGDRRWLRAKEIKDSPKSQAVPKILIHKKMTLPGSTLAQVPLLSPILTCMTSFPDLASSNALRFPPNRVNLGPLLCLFKEGRRCRSFKNLLCKRIVYCSEIGIFF